MLDQQKKCMLLLSPLATFISITIPQRHIFWGNIHIVVQGHGKGTVMLKFPTTVIAPSMYIPACVVYTIFFLSPSKIQTEGNLLLQCLGSQRGKKAAPLSAECSQDGWVYDSTLLLLSLSETQTPNPAVFVCARACACELTGCVNSPGGTPGSWEIKTSPKM